MHEVVCKLNRLVVNQNHMATRNKKMNLKTDLNANNSFNNNN